MKNFYSSVTFALTLATSLFLEFPTLSWRSRVEAKDALTYVPPPRTRRAQRTEGVGSRGNCPKNISILLLAPSDHVGQTTLGHPTFLWSTSSTDVPIRFTLTEAKVAEPVVDLIVPLQEPGIVKFTLPKTSKELVPNREYRWTVSALCNPRRPSENIYAYAHILRVPQQGNIEQQLATLTNSRERAQLYAASGIWYDALETAHSNYQTHPYQPLTSSFFWDLLDEVGLSKIALSQP